MDGDRRALAGQERHNYLPNTLIRSTAGRMLAPLATAEEIDVLQAEEAVQVCTSTSSSESSSRSSNRTSSSAWSSEMTAVKLEAK
ncbi:Adenylyltransferase and sulfurtransferase uba4 [Trichinella spiralis]|uniref:Adenylyltransferase and sulfurtransferase uba4 n=1 Tax=Trichinella spiralis TaxID=6334 RepID=A0ABR3KDL0_TRISP